MVTFLIGGEPVRTSMLANKPEYSTSKTIVAIKHRTRKRIKAKIRKSDIMRQSHVKVARSNYSLWAMSLNTVQTVNSISWRLASYSLQFGQSCILVSNSLTSSDSAAVTGELCFLKSLVESMEIYMPLGKRSTYTLRCISLLNEQLISLNTETVQVLLPGCTISHLLQGWLGTFCCMF